MATRRAIKATQNLESPAAMTTGQRTDLQVIVNNNLNNRKGRTNMTPTTATNATKKRIQRTVFDLTAFQKVKLVKDVEMPKKPESIKEALEMVGGEGDPNSTARLLQVIYDGLAADVSAKAWDDITGFKLAGKLEADEDGVQQFVAEPKLVNDPKAVLPEEDYTGKYADENKEDLINAAILSIAKMQGYDKSLSKEKKAELKEKAADFLRSNPAMLASIQG